MSGANVRHAFNSSQPANTNLLSLPLLSFLHIWQTTTYRPLWLDSILFAVPFEVHMKTGLWCGQLDVLILFVLGSRFFISSLYFVVNCQSKLVQDFLHLVLSETKYTQHLSLQHLLDYVQRCWPVKKPKMLTCSTLFITANVLQPE